MLDQVSESVVWLIFFLPLISLGLILLLPRSAGHYAGYIAAIAIGIAFVLALWVLDSSLDADGHQLAFASEEWLRVGDVSISVALNVDGLSAVMLVVVTGISFLVQVYSTGYMKGDGGYYRYFAYMSLFTASMLGLVLMESLVMIYVFWEMVGASSFLLIGFWFDRPAAAAAAKKAFLVTRLGDLGFLMAILLLYAHTGTFDIGQIHELALTGVLGGTTLTVFALGVFAGAAGKSAQVPFHVWLPDAMEGPTPVSALIHSATMVAAGVYLVARLFPVFSQSTDAMHVVGAIGGITAISAAMLALVMTDIKRVLAYSTISQLGYMMLALGVGGYVAAIFHLAAHAFFKTLLFLGSGSVNHATGTFDMRLMGGLAKPMRWTFVTFLVGSLSLAGVFPLAGFWSKDEILSDAWANEKYLFWIAFVTAGLTAFYIFRVIFLTFTGEYRGGDPAAAHTTTSEDEHASASHHEVSPHESPINMVVPMLVLAIVTLFVGFANIDNGLEHLLVGALPDEGLVEDTEFRLAIALGSTAMALGGIAVAYAIYGAKIIPSTVFSRTFRPIHVLLENKYYADVLYEQVIVGFLFYRVIGGALSTFDRVIVDGAVNGIGRGARQSASIARYVQNGQFQTYGALAFSGVVFTAIVVLVLSPL